MKFQSTITRSSKVSSDARLKQTQGIFDLPPAASQTLNWTLDLELPDEWSVGAIVGESGSGKTTIARELAAQFGSTVIESKDAQGNLREPFEWSRDKAVCSAMPSMPIRDWTGLLSRVGFSSPPAWCRPYQVLSNGQQFRANLARAIAENANRQDAKSAKNQSELGGAEGPGVLAVQSPPPVFFDEFASLVHDQVAKIASAAVAKAVRAMNRRFVAVTWRTDILDSLEPDWVIFCGSDQSVKLQLNAARGSLQWRRPAIDLRIVRTDPSAWALFKGHHYLSGDLHRSARCFVGLIDHQPAAFTAVLHFPHPSRPCWREHRMVCLPDYQGVGIGNAMSEAVAAIFKSLKRYTSTTSHPAMIRHRAKSPLWRMIRKPSMVSKPGEKAHQALARTASAERLTASFEYVGEPDEISARRFGLMPAAVQAGELAGIEMV